jgi:hypothetical protein
MARRTVQRSEGFGSDSFMDVVTNVVGILIILVLVVGIRVQQAPPEVFSEARSAPDLGELQAAVHALTDETAALAAQTAAVARQTRAADAEAVRLTERIAAGRQALALRQTEREQQMQSVSSVEREHATALAQLDLLQQELDQAATARPEAITIDSYPTPISRSVEGPEAHFQIKGGRIVFIPLDDLLSRLRSDAREQIWKLRDQPEATSSVGPLGGFRLRFTLDRVDMNADDKRGGSRPGGSYARLSQWTLIPVTGQLGEPLDEALAAGSEFHQALRGFDPRRATVTLWTYPDSFPEYRRLRRELYELGFPTAGRPLPDGHPIGGSPEGSKSAAQ